MLTIKEHATNHLLLYHNIVLLITGLIITIIASKYIPVVVVDVLRGYEPWCGLVYGH